MPAQQCNYMVWLLLHLGSESQCKDKQIQLEQICENISDKDEESADEDDSMAVVTMKKKGNCQYYNPCRWKTNCTWMYPFSYQEQERAQRSSN